MKKLSSITLPIKGRSWEFSLLPDKTFDKMHNSDDSGGLITAMTVTNKYEVHFKKSEWTLTDIRHEMKHVFFTMARTETADLTPTQVEELCCQIFALDGTEMTLLSEKVAEKFFNHNK